SAPRTRISPCGFISAGGGWRSSRRRPPSVINSRSAAVHAACRTGAKSSAPWSARRRLLNRKSVQTRPSEVYIFCLLKSKSSKAGALTLKKSLRATGVFRIRGGQQMFRVFNCLTSEHDWRLVIVAGIVCFLASLTAISLFNRARATAGRVRAAWIVAAGAAAGCGGWATHFIAMLAYGPGGSIALHLPPAPLSLVAAGGLAVAVYVPARWSAPRGGAIVGGGIACMHCTGMWAVELPGRVTWWPGLVAVSVALGMLFGTGALLVAARRDTLRTMALAAVLLTLAIVSHHFTAMGAIEIVPDPTPVITAFSLS